MTKKITGRRAFPFDVMLRAFYEGYAANRNGLALKCNPHRHTDLHEAWIMGWQNYAQSHQTNASPQSPRRAASA